MKETIAGEIIRSIRLFNDLTHDEIQQLLDASEDTRYEAGHVIFDEGDQSRALYIMLEGSVRIAVKTPLTGQTELVTVGPREVFGESSFFHPSPHHASAQCTSPVRLILLSRERYDVLLQSGSAAAYKLAVNAADLLAERLQQTDEWVEGILQGRQNAELLSDWKKYRGSLRFNTKGSAGMFRP